MQTLTTFIDAAQVATELGMSRASFLRRRDDFERGLGFPPPMPHTARPLKWRADQVTAWISAQGLPGRRDQVVAGDNVVLMAEARRA